MGTVAGLSRFRKKTNIRHSEHCKNPINISCCCCSLIIIILGYLMLKAMHFPLSHVSQTRLKCARLRSGSLGNTLRWRCAHGRFLALKSTSSQAGREGSRTGQRETWNCNAVQRPPRPISLRALQLSRPFGVVADWTKEFGFLCNPHSTLLPHGGVTGYRLPPGIPWAG